MAAEREATIVGAVRGRVVSRAALVAWALYVLAVGAQVAGWTLAAANGEPHPPLGLLGEGAAFGLFAVGPVIASRQPRNPIGWIFTGSSALIALGGAGNFLQEYAVYALVMAPASLPAGEAASVVRPALSALGFFPLVTFLLLLFPTGRLPSRQWRWVALAAAIAIAAVAFVPVLRPGELPGRPRGVLNPIGVDALGPIIEAAKGPVTVLLISVVLACVVSVFARFRGASGIERVQLRWFAYGASFIPIIGGLIPAVTWLDLPGKQQIVTVLYPAILIPVVVSIAIAMLRFRLYDIDVLINRTLVYGATVATLGALYVSAIVGLQGLLRQVTQGSELAVALSTLGAVALFDPVRSRVQRGVDRRFYRSGYDAARTLDSLALRLRDQVDVDALRGELLSAVRDTMQPAHASLWLRERP